MSATLTFLKLVPRNALSRLVGWFLRGPWPRFVHQGVIRWFIGAFDVDVSESRAPVKSFPTFTAFFTRTLVDGARPIAEAPDAVASPCDGTFGISGPIEGDAMLQAKGRPYSVASFLGDEALAASYQGGYFVTIYLAPWNYHRVHSPVEGAITHARHIPGTLWPVNPPAVARIEDLFAVNERLVTLVETPRGQVAVVMVGATCVGRIRMGYDDLVTNDGRTHPPRDYEPAIPIEKGGELGVFEMGSTVIMLFPPSFYRPDPAVSAPGTPVRMGAAIGHLD